MLVPRFKLSTVSSAVFLVFSQSQLALAEEVIPLSPITVQGERIIDLPALSNSVLDQSAAGGLGVGSSDTTSLLTDVPGVSAYSAGGVSGLPSIHGLADDRLRIKVDGMDSVSSCPNHMNSPLSYTTPTNLGLLKVYTGITPVSLGGDSIGGTIIAESKAPEFAAPGEKLLTKGNLGAFYRSNGDGRGANVSATVASENLSISYAGSTAQADNYTAGGNFKNYTATGRTGHTLDLDEVGSTAYKARNHEVNVALKGGDHLLEAKIGYQDIPYELYPNQRMDMLDNQQKRFNLKYLGAFNWGKLEARAYHESVDHYMDFGADKMFTYGTGPLAAPGMPMYTKGNTNGASVKSEIVLTEEQMLRIGAEYQAYRLDDWWPPSPNCGTCMGGMAPNTFWNINNGKRDRAGVFGEVESKWNKAWSSLIGLRYEHVSTDVDPVQGYNSVMYGNSSVGNTASFNKMDRSRSDGNFDFTALANYFPDQTKMFEFGYSRKTRSPNLYERYSWSRSVMALEMNNFVGDGNGYLGNPDLKPEIAHTVSATGNWHAEDKAWEFKATPYLTYVDDYIDAVQWVMSNSMMTAPNVGTPNQQAIKPATGKFVTMKYMNQSARIFGLDLSGTVGLGHNSLGDWGLKGFVSYINGENRDTGSGLYNIMPLNAKASLTHKLGAWNNALEVIGVNSKHDVSDARNEIKTPGYALVNLKSSYTWKNIRVDFGIDNLFDKMYYLPQGGAYTGQGATMSFNREIGNITPTGGNRSMWGTEVPGMGRSVYAGVNVSF